MISVEGKKVERGKPRKKEGEIKCINIRGLKGRCDNGNEREGREKQGE